MEGGEDRGVRRSFALSAIMLITFAMIAIFGVTFVVLFLVTLFFAGTYITWLYIPLWTPAIISFGAYIVAVLDSQQKARIYAQSSVIAALLGGVGTIFMIIAGYYYISIWLRCLFPWIGTLSTLENIMCNDEYWVLWVTFVWTLVFLAVALGVFLSAGYDAFTRVSRMNLFSMAQSGFEQKVDVFGQGFQKAFGQSRRLGRSGRGFEEVGGGGEPGAPDPDLGLEGGGFEEDEDPLREESTYRFKKGRRGGRRGGNPNINYSFLSADKRRRASARNNGRPQRRL